MTDFAQAFQKHPNSISDAFSPVMQSQAHGIYLVNISLCSSFLIR